MARIIMDGKEFYAKPLWEKFLLETDFTSDKNPYLHEYLIDGTKVTREDFEQRYRIACSKAFPKL